MPIFTPGGGPHGTSIRTAVEHPLLAETVTHLSLLDDTGGEPTFADGERIRVQIASPDAEDFELTPIGQDDELAFVLTAMEDAGLRDDDRVWYDSGTGDGEKPYRLTAPRPTTIAGDTFVAWAMIPDTRGEGGDGSGGSGGSGGGSNGSSGDGSNDGVFV